MRIVIDHGDPAPPYEQICRQVTALAKAGELRPGDRLPTVRGLAEQLGLAVNTVAKAYRELETRGAIETRGRSGSFVTGDDTRRVAGEAASAFVAQARGLGLSDDEVLALVRHALGLGSRP